MFIPVFFSLIAGMVIGGIIYWVKGSVFLAIVITLWCGFFAYIAYEAFGLMQEEGYM